MRLIEANDTKRELSLEEKAGLPPCEGALVLLPGSLRDEEGYRRKATEVDELLNVLGRRRRRDLVLVENGRALDDNKFSYSLDAARMYPEARLEWRDLLEVIPLLDQIGYLHADWMGSLLEDEIDTLKFLTGRLSPTGARVRLTFYANQRGVRWRDVESRVEDLSRRIGRHVVLTDDEKILVAHNPAIQGVLWLLYTQSLGGMTAKKIEVRDYVNDGAPMCTAWVDFYPGDVSQLKNTIHELLGRKFYLSRRDKQLAALAADRSKASRGSKEWWKHFRAALPSDTHIMSA